MGALIKIEEYFKSIDLHDETIGFKLSHCLSDHPVGFRRMKALKEAKEKEQGIFIVNSFDLIIENDTTKIKRREIPFFFE
ncbi:TPA: hypothetical protein ACUI23_001478 [Staphylococcus pseudintermedius]